jgi:thiamine-monophosphate kinase
MLPTEFARIDRHFRPLAGPGALDLADDAAVFAPPPGRELVISADAMVEGVHWLPGTSPDLVARKLLRVNLSDVAAMGATPFGYLLTVSVPRSVGEDWFAGFSAGLALDQAEFDVTLLGGDTTETPGPISLALTIIGHCAIGEAIRRSGAKAGDELWVTGTIGDGRLGLAAARGELPDPDGYLVSRYNLPTPRLGLPLQGLANAAMDVSDGLVQDIGHVCRASSVGAVIEAHRVPLSLQAQAAGSGWREAAITGGDDYELVLAVPAGRRDVMESLAVRTTRIGYFKPGEGTELVNETGQSIALSSRGWSHFA